MKISAVNYLNSKPFVKGLRGSLPEGWELSLDIPSECARKLKADEADIGLVPVAILNELNTWYILSKYCIGANGKVDSVKLYSRVPLKEIKKIVLDYQSRTSVALTKILAKRYWQISPEWEAGTPGFEDHIKDTTAAVVIGDRTFQLNGKFPYEFDLSEEWQKLTGLPFVFAVWAGKKPLSVEDSLNFEALLSKGLEQKDVVIREEEPHYPGTDIADYLNRSIQYHLDDKKRAGLDLFIQWLKEDSLS